MNKSVMLSIQPRHCENICTVIGEENGKPVYKKAIEVRKTRPQLETPFKCYIYCTASDVHSCLMIGGNEAKLIHCCNYKTAIPVGGEIGNGKVIGEFVCDKIDRLYIPISTSATPPDREDVEKYTCLSLDELKKYANGEMFLYGWHISDFKIYDTPKELWEFDYPCTGKECNKCQYEVREKLPFSEIGVCCGRYHITRPFQSWGYCEELIECKGLNLEEEKKKIED